MELNKGVYMSNDGKINRIRIEVISPDGIADYLSNEELVKIRDSLYLLLQEIENPSELHIHTRVAESVIKIMEGRVVSFGDNVFMYNNTTGVWDDAKTAIGNIAEAVYISNGANRSEIFNKISMWSQSDREDWDKIRRRYIGVKNGTWDIIDSKFIGHDKEQHLLAIIPVDYNDTATCPAIDKFFVEIVLPDAVPLLYEWAGYCMTDEMFIQQALMLHGKGSNGKSVLIKLLKAFLGDRNTVSIPLHKLMTSNFASAELYGKKANLYADLSADALKDSGVFKVLIAGDQMSGEKKFRDQFNFENCSKQIYSANTIPRTMDFTDGFFRRWCIIDFPNQFEGDAADTKLIHKLITPTELSGLLNKAIEGLKVLHTNQKFSMNRTTDGIRLMYLRLSDSVAAFSQECVEQDPDGYKLPKEQWVEYYFEYCRKSNIVAVSQDLFFKLFPKMVKLQERKLNIDGERERVWVGIKFKENVKTVNISNTNLNQATL